MSKIGILTLVSANNCGSQLQAFALQYILKNLLHANAELINFHPAFARRMYKLFHLSYLKVPINFFRSFRSLLRQQQAYDNFRIKHLGLKKGEELYSTEEFFVHSKQYDKIIVGSDQVWNVNMADFDPAYFLEGYQGKKHSYAASLGGGEQIVVPDGLLQYKQGIEDFASLSVREPQGKKVLQNLTDKEIQVNIDPTLLVPVDVWSKLAGERIVDGDYIYYYSYNYGDNELNVLVQKAAQKLNLPVYVINASRWVNRRPQVYGFHLSTKEGPIAFLSLMKHAKYVFVQSLHGSIFAYIFKANFWFLNNRELDILDQRSQNILELLGKRDRTIRPNNFDNIDIKRKCEYPANEKIVIEKGKAIDYLKKIGFDGKN